MMLDQKMAFDEVVQRHAKDPAAVTRILANPVYAQISGSLAGSQEYAAMAKLHDFDRTGEWDTIVVGKPGAFVLKRLAKFVGSQFINDLGVFFTEFNDILGGFKQRAEETFALLRQSRVG